jgi:hypothetical protein
MLQQPIDGKILLLSAGKQPPIIPSTGTAKWKQTCPKAWFSRTLVSKLGAMFMLAKCANPACSTKFLRLNEGKLFQVETEFVARPAHRRGRMAGKARTKRRTEHFWLCPECAPFVTLAFDKHEGIITIPLPHGKATKHVVVVDPGFVRASEKAVTDKTGT